jgi:hypothetical protein
MKRIVLLCVSIFPWYSVYAGNQKPDCRSYIQYGGVRYCIASTDTTNDISPSVVKEEVRTDQRHLEIVSPFSSKTIPAESQQEVPSGPPIDFKREDMVR